MFPTLRLQLSEGGCPKSFRELFDILSQQLTGKSDSETGKKKRKGWERPGKKGLGEEDGPLGGWGWAGQAPE